MAADLFTELCGARFAEFSSRVMVELEGEGPVLARLAEVARAYVRYAQEHPEQYRVLFKGPVAAPRPVHPRPRERWPLACW